MNALEKQCRIYEFLTKDIVSLLPSLSPSSPASFEIAVVGFSASAIVNSCECFQNCRLYTHGIDTSRDSFRVGSLHGIEYPPLKVFISSSHIVYTTADLVLKSFREIAFVFERTTDIYIATKNYIEGLKAVDIVEGLIL